MQQGQVSLQKRLTEVFKKHWKIGAVMSLLNLLFMLLYVGVFIGTDMFFVDGAFSVHNFKDFNNLILVIPLVILFAQFVFCLIPTVKGFLNRNDAEMNIGHDREDG